MNNTTKSILIGFSAAFITLACNSSDKSTADAGDAAVEAAVVDDAATETAAPVSSGDAAAAAAPAASGSAAPAASGSAAPEAASVKTTANGAPTSVPLPPGIKPYVPAAASSTKKK